MAMETVGAAVLDARIICAVPSAGVICDPVGRFSSSGPSSPTSVGPPIQLDVPRAFFPNNPQQRAEDATPPPPDPRSERNPLIIDTRAISSAGRATA